MTALLTLFFIIIAYLVGSLSSAIIVSKLMHLPDPRTTGSGNAGATNVFRISGRCPVVISLIFDVLKGVIPLLLAALAGLKNFNLALVAFAATAGHIFPIYFKFKGGKGVATTFGGVLILSFWVALIGIIIWAVVLLLSRYVSLASLIATGVGTILLLFVHVSYFLPILAATLLIIWKHKENIERLRAGTENKMVLRS